MSNYVIEAIKWKVSFGDTDFYFDSKEKMNQFLELVKELRPCPFCGSTNISHYLRPNGNFDGHYVKCNQCKSTGPDSKSNEESYIAWNKRTEDF